MIRFGRGPWLQWLQWVVAVACLIVGVAGLVLPLVPGVVLLLVGVMLAPSVIRRPTYRWLRRVLTRVGLRRRQGRDTLRSQSGT